MNILAKDIMPYINIAREIISGEIVTGKLFFNMNNLICRKSERVQIGGDVEFYINDRFYTGCIANTSLGGVFIEPHSKLPEFQTGLRTDINILDVLSNKTFSFVTSVVRSSDNGLALKFSKELTLQQRQFIEEWLEVVSEP